MKGHSSSSREVDVFVRIRPTTNFAQDLIECLPDGQTINIYQKKDPRKLQESRKSPLNSWSFRLEGVLHNLSQEVVYTRVCKRVVLEALDGYNGTVMCFGQTGAGKTYTMTGSVESYGQRGIIPRALQEVFQEVKKRTEQSFSVHLSYLEIYNETLVDLLSSLQATPRLSPQPMVVMEEPGRGVFIKGLSLCHVHSEEEALSLLFEGEMNRIIGSHVLNRRSSRSHCILTVHIESHSRTLSDAKYVTSKLNLVDLAGSERLGKTGSEGQMLKEAKYINKSLSFLEQTILALADQRRDHVPFRQTKLTHALKDSLGGNCNTVLVANIYGEAAQIEETLSTLRFASRMKCVRTDPAVNEHVDPAAQIKKLQKEVQTLKDELSFHNILLERPNIPREPLSEAQLAEIQSQVHKYLEGSLQEITIFSISQVQAVFAQFKIAVQLSEQKVKAQLCQTYNLVKKDQSAYVTAIKEMKNRGSPEDRETGSVDSPKQTHRPRSTTFKQKSRDKRSLSKKRDEESPAVTKHLESTSKSKPNLVQTPDREAKSQEEETQQSQLFDIDSTRPESPPPKAQAFEVFKMGPGSTINSILKENKSVLTERCSLLQQLTEVVNTIKRKIDNTTATLQQHEEMGGEQVASVLRSVPTSNMNSHDFDLNAAKAQLVNFNCQETAAHFNYLDEGQCLFITADPVLQDADTPLLVQLRELKAQYRQRYKVVRNIKAEVNYCEHLVDQCRVRLLSEFETWYKQTFLLPEELDECVDRDCTQEEHSPWYLEPQGELLTSSSNSESFYNAHYRMLKRRNSRLFSGTQRETSAGSGCRTLPLIRPFTQVK
ncbi:kinesin-like protein KIF9 [Pholidichthys leucotaenia]